jgi:hypothetical protein
VSQLELWFHGIELAVMIFGVAAPIIWSAFRLRSVLKDFPPHRHLNGKVIYPIGYAPSRTETIEEMR